MAKKKAVKKKAAKKKVAKKAAPKKKAPKKKAPKKKAAKKKAPKKKAAVKDVGAVAPKKRTRRKRKQTIKKLFWVVFSSTMKPVAKFEFHEKKEALAKVESLSKKSPHFLQKRKEEIEVQDEQT